VLLERGFLQRTLEDVVNFHLGDTVTATAGRDGPATGDTDAMEGLQ